MKQDYLLDEIQNSKNNKNNKNNQNNYGVNKYFP